MTSTAITAAVPRKRCALSGQVISVVARVQPWVRFEVELGDGTGSITLRFLGRTEVPGVVPGRRLHVEGTPSVDGGILIMLNPLYSFAETDPSE